MRCPVDGCMADTKVLETRDKVLRLRCCRHGHRFWTEEEFRELAPYQRKQRSDAKRPRAADPILQMQLDLTKE